MSSPYGIHWFRRDLRVAGNLALRHQFQRHEGRVVGVFCFDKEFLSRPDFSVNRFQLFLNRLADLKKELQELGSDLLLMDVGPEVAIPRLLEALRSQNIPNPDLFSWSRDYEPFARERDQKVLEMMRSHRVPTLTCRDHLVIEPHELEKNDGGGYQVYTPFSRKWLEVFKTDEVQKRIGAQKVALEFLKKQVDGTADARFKLTWERLFNGKPPLKDHLDEYIEINQKRVTVEIPSTSASELLHRLESFRDRLGDYQDKRDLPSGQHTSRFSMYLKNGSLTTAQIIAFLQLKPYQKKEDGPSTFFSELIWREFYYHILYRHPNVETNAFIPKYRDLKWRNNEDWFQKWKEGKTGFPIVDAGMRELATTGWMHNRVRMIVASFLTKDLLIDWRWGEKYFMETLLDGDLAPNNGGWQWAASTGCDPQPYFRIFNPWLQSQKFDPDGEYIKRYIPELADTEAKKLHAPIEGHGSYPEPIIDHKVQKTKALLLYKSAAD